jgi:hypothetical protein
MDAWSRYLPCSNIRPSLSPENQNIGTVEKDQGVECSKIVPVASADWNTGTDEAGSGVPIEITERNTYGTANALKCDDCSNVPKNTTPLGGKRVIRI